MNFTVNTLLKFYFLFFPFYIIGVSVGGYNVTLGTFGAIFLTIIAVLTGRKFQYFHILPLLLFLIWSLIITILKHPFLSYGPSLVSLAIMSLPFFFEYKKRDLIDIEKYLIYGFLISFPFVLYDLSVTLLGATPIENLNIPLLIESRSDRFFGVYRAKALFEEPSFFAIYLVALFYFLNKREKSSFLINSCIIVSIISTLSLTGFILFVLSYGILFYSSYKQYIYALAFVGCLILVFPQYVQNIIHRINQSIAVVEQANLVGSAGSRMNSFDPVIRYYKKEGINGFLAGLGYGNTSEWLVNEYQYHENRRISFVRGQINNAFSLILLSTGIFGFILYFLIFLIPFLTKKIGIGDFILIVFIQFAFAILIGYFFWGIMLLFKLSNK